MKQENDSYYFLQMLWFTSYKQKKPTNRVNTHLLIGSLSVCLALWWQLIWSVNIYECYLLTFWIIHCKMNNCSSIETAISACPHPRCCYDRRSPYRVSGVSLWSRHKLLAGPRFSSTYQRSVLRRACSVRITRMLSVEPSFSTWIITPSRNCVSRLLSCSRRYNSQL